jgi:glucose-1-phosphate thymidylyltransferase
MQENVSLAIVDTVGEPADEAGLGPSSPYLAPIANVPLIWHVFDELAQSGIARALIVARTEARGDLERVLGTGETWGVEVSFFEAPETGGQQAVLTQADQALSAGPVLVYPGDCLFPGQLATIGERFADGDVDCVMLDPAPGSASPESRIFPTAVILGPQTQAVLRNSASGGLDPRGLNELLLAGGCRVAVCEPARQWRYSNSTDALLAANRMMLDELPVPAVDGSFPDHNEIHGRVAISPDAHVSNSVIYGPVVIDDDAVVEDSYVGPYTAIGRGATVSGGELDNTMVLARAEIRHPGMRIEASIIGERASVSRSFELPKGLHLRLGTGSRVILS